MKSNKKPEKINIGGQAVIEGVLMRSPHFYSIAVCKKNKKIVHKSGRINSLSDKYKFLKWPFIRGFLVLYESLILGYKALDYSANIFEDGNSPRKKNINQNFENIIAFITSILFAILFFIVTPYYLMRLIEAKIKTAGQNSILFNLGIGIFKILIFLLYVWIISFIKDIKRIFMYHGAEHKTIFAYEESKNLNYSNIKKYPTIHPRCGTAFIFITFVISIIFFALFLPPKFNILYRIFIEIPLIIPIAGVSYEILKLTDKFKNNFLIKIFIFPGLAFQKITTMQPDKMQILTAIKAAQTVINLEKKYYGRKK
ncbi:MAG: DUF1385 domain-containing protein [Candidatus Goldbacteria bacterium]|nr:DUF1385 domain-containing protein [Candidatus Goldiibacteriota bacterium]